ncbi:GNAT family N-acetyltransferase [Crassaminicella profunda]|uniref:GNAT family N-acetyltransferase n=1 Tax=Crassaminicella profunda TaxID=1286698 RepID=UPI001CA68DBD|nr:GNAT family protein [Crassaminicella profunda]QZY55796.1 GNAT family N-acetyltransferase [Crassaminicella profunda]
MKVLITTESLNICPAKEEDIPIIMKMENDEENKSFIWQGSFQEHLDEINSDTALLLIFREKKENNIVGYALARMNFKFDVFELRRIAISKKKYGYGKEALLGIMKYSFEKLNTNRFWLDVYPHNKVGIHLYKSIGMHLDGVMRQSYKDERGYLDQMIFSMLKEEYSAK